MFPISAQVKSGTSLGLLSAFLCTFVASAARADDFEIRVSHVGYLPDSSKVATVANELGTGWTLRDASDASVVASGDLSDTVVGFVTGLRVQMADFTQVAAPGIYYLEGHWCTAPIRARLRPLGQSAVTPRGSSRASQDRSSC